jgi:peptide deformylase
MFPAMAILKIARMGHPVLLQRAEPVPDPRDPEITRLVADMIETMHDASGAGLAAPQVHVPLRLFVYHVPQARSAGEDDPPRGVAALINPVIEPIGDDITVAYEGCLSIPGLRGAVPRPASVRYSGVDEKGRAVDGIATGFLALVLQHENDHLDGILYPTRMTDLSTLAFLEELQRFPPEPAS